jgi:FkbM family methyltransferase
MRIKGLFRAMREPQRTFWRIFSLAVMNYQHPRYNKTLYDFCRKYVNFYNNDETGDRETNGQWRWLAEYMQSKPKVIFDIGGFAGDYSERILKADPSADLHVFEPNPQTFTKLVSRLSRFRGVRLVEKGVSDKVGSMSLFTSEKYPAMNSIHYRGGSTHKVDGKVEVEVTTVDAYCAENDITHIDLLKIDTEGNDYFVLKGAERMLREGGGWDNRIRVQRTLYLLTHLFLGFCRVSETLGLRHFKDHAPRHYASRESRTGTDTRRVFCSNQGIKPEQHGTVVPRLYHFLRNESLRRLSNAYVEGKRDFANHIKRCLGRLLISSSWVNV